MSLVKTKFELKIVYGEGAKYDELDYKEGVVYFCTDTDGEYKGIIILNDIKYGSTENDSTEDKDIEALQKEIASLGAELDDARDSIVSLTDTVNGKQDALTAGTGIAIEDNVVSVTLDTTLYKVVTALPEAPDAEDENKIFLIEAENDTEGNVFVEYLWVNSAWEKIGEESAADIDLSNYVTTDYLDHCISDSKKQISSRIDSLNNIESCEHHEAYNMYVNGKSGNTSITYAYIALDSMAADVSFPEEGKLMSIWIPKDIACNITQDKELNIGYAINGGGIIFCNDIMPLYTCSVDYAKFENNESIDAVIFSGAEDTEVQYFDKNVWSERGFNMIVQNIGEKLLWLNPPPLKSSSK